MTTSRPPPAPAALRGADAGGADAATSEVRPADHELVVRRRFAAPRFPRPASSGQYGSPARDRSKPKVRPTRTTLSMYALNGAGTLKLYIGTPATMVSAASSSSTSPSLTARCRDDSGVRSAGGVKAARIHSPVTGGGGSWPTSR
jgi:hypothetical protein